MFVTYFPELAAIRDDPRYRELAAAF